MKNLVKTYVKKPQTILAVVVALMAQLIFCLVWMTAYDGVLDRTDHLKVAIVNEDGEFGKNIENQLSGTLPFEVTAMSKEQAMDGLVHRNVHLILTIPDQFGEKLTTPGTQAVLTYSINESNPQLTKSVMQTVITKVTNEMNRNASLQGTQMVLEQLKLPSNQASQTAESLLNKIGSDVKSLNPVNGMHNQMVPMMLVLASYVGSMLMAMNIHQASEAVGSALTKWQHFRFRLLINGFAAALISIVGSSLIAVFGGQMESGFGLFWMFHFLTMLTFLFVAQLFLTIFGMAGMFINMTMLSMQLVTSGTIVPRQMLSHFYQSLGSFLPATPAVEGIMNLQFGGQDTAKDVWLLLLTILVSVSITVVITFLKKQEGLNKVSEAERDSEGDLATNAI
ncbi:YhgE/Pip domain-containing protein [Paenibacillus sabinae]|uniref:ABC-2 type transporter transmembrane domain-containing protein n=1 Tax=Paenibacillus sabinae T27 TaxID=1268072 RepID=X4ZVH3_9BACL|nr:ABC transporter permease [Paenibacillus sabinae]AHV95749.1 hypothetical protein PSAB_04065 [Paenibacillus sabinae T27]